MPIQVIKRNDTTTNWTTNNPILALAEEGYDIDLKKFKIGDGSSTWTALPFFESGTGGGDSSGNIDGGDAAGVYLISQVLDSGGA